MKIILTKKEAEEYFYNALCNSLTYVYGYGLKLKFPNGEYDKAKESLEKKNTGNTICYEDVLMEILRMGMSLKIEDCEDDGTYTRTISIEDVHERVAKTPITHLLAMINEEDDATTADVILQTVFFQDVIFG